MRRNRANKHTPRVIVGCVADTHSNEIERVIEFTFPSGRGGLILLQEDPAVGGVASVSVYRVDPGVRVFVPQTATDVEIP